jgi:hypothetical protein
MKLGHGTWTIARLAGAALAAGALLASVAAAEVSAQPTQYRLVTKDEVAQQVNAVIPIALPIEGPDCNSAVKPMPGIELIDGCTFYVGGTTWFNSAGTADVGRLVASDPQKVADTGTEFRNDPAHTAVPNLGDWAFYTLTDGKDPKGQFDTKIRTVELVVGVGSEMISAQIQWQKDPAPVNDEKTIEAAQALARLALEG